MVLQRPPGPEAMLPYKSMAGECWNHTLQQQANGNSEQLPLAGGSLLQPEVLDVLVPLLHRHLVAPVPALVVSALPPCWQQHLLLQDTHNLSVSS